MLEKKKITTKERTPLNGISSKNNHFAYDMIVFSHLRWDFVYQRPQHLISRIAKHYKILFVEEPIPTKNSDENGLDLEFISPNLSVVKPRVSSILQIPKILRRLNIEEIKIAWFYSPAFMEVLHCIPAQHVVYDCMDELSLFKGAPLIIKEQEEELIKIADLIMTGGVSLYEEKSKYSPYVYCFPSSVDYQHFSKSKKDLKIPEDIQSIEKPIIGYIGVIDERIDMDLLKQTAELLPHHHFVMIGPVVKIDKKDLAQAENIHYLGMKSYDVLPNYLKAFDIAMMPFSLNDATKFISPTKTLEYMAADLPIISTAIKDVVRTYKDCVQIIHSPQSFKQAIENHFSTENSNFKDKYKEILQKTSWDNTASEMLNLLKIMKS